MKRGEPVIKLPPPTVYPHATDNVRLRPKLKKPDRELSAEEVAVNPQLAPKPLRRMMGFREWCEKVYDPQRNGSNQSSTTRGVDVKS